MLTLPIEHLEKLVPGTIISKDRLARAQTSKSAAEKKRPQIRLNNEDEPDSYVAGFAVSAAGANDSQIARREWNADFSAIARYA